MHIKQERKCIACRENHQQNEMIRIAKFNNQIFIDKSSSGNGRGAYICKNKNCINLAIKKQALNRAFKTNVDKEIYIQLGEYE